MNGAMTSLLDLIESRAREAMAAAGCADAAANVQPSARAEHGDYQVNGVMGAAKARRTDPRALAQRVLEHLDLGGIAARIDIAGPGFINITVSAQYLARWATAAALSDGLGVPRAGDAERQRVVIDYSSPNLAKEMHVGHLRSTIIGDALARVLRFIGHEVIAQNHVGDWGTQFGMLTASMEEAGGGGAASAGVADLEAFYRTAKQRFDDDPPFAKRAREYVVRLQAGDARVRALWRRFLDVSMGHCEEIYRTLGVGLTPADVRGESAYNDDLAPIVADLSARGLAVASAGAQVVYLEQFKNKEGGPAAYMVQKQDGGYLYATTDLAAIRHRIRVLRADRILYVVDARQKLHFEQLFALAFRAGYAPAGTRMEHVGFGVILGEDGKPFKTRSGETVKLADLLAEAVQRAFDLVSSKNPGLPESERRAIARVIGIGAVKYADLSRNRGTDYVFDWGGMLSFDGNTAPYLQYAYTRIRAVCRRADESGADRSGMGTAMAATMVITAPAERQLALKLAQFADAVHLVARTAEPHHLCAYLYDLSAALMRFYEACPVLAADGALRAGRLQLCRLSADTLRTGLGMLGIGVLESM
jgi:arginyl-tRNA synthetase